MPTYVYKCDQCDHAYELIHFIHETDQDRFCPDCKSKVKRIVSLGAVTFKGNGWGGDHVDSSSAE